MNGTTARAYVVSRLTDGQLKSLHWHEKEIGYCLPAGAIHDRFRTERWGDVPEEASRRVESDVMKIFFRVTNQYRAKNQEKFLLDSVPITHSVDSEIKNAGIVFSTSDSGVSKYRQKLQEAVA